jgi:NADH-quinone oxidoreductase subunit N
MIAIGTMISLAYYLRVVAAIWMRPGREPSPETMPAIAGASQEADERGRGVNCKVILGLIGVAAAATVFFGVIPSPLVDWATAAGEAIDAVLD